jgi:hypothetical protein
MRLAPQPAAVGGGAYAAAGLYAVYGAGFFCLLVTAMVKQPLFPAQVSPARTSARNSRAIRRYGAADDPSGLPLRSSASSRGATGGC